MRIKRGFAAHQRRKRVIKRAKGFIHGRSKKYRLAKEALLKAGNYAYRDRRAKKRDFRSLWVLRINAACREHGTTYSAFIAGLKKKDITLNRKAIQQIAVEYPQLFAKIVETIK